MIAEEDGGFYLFSWDFSSFPITCSRKSPDVFGKFVQKEIFFCTKNIFRTACSDGVNMALYEMSAGVLCAC